MTEQKQPMDKRRFTDGKLQDFYDEFQKHMQDEDAMHKETRQAIETNTALVQQIQVNTKDILDAWTSAQGALRTMAVIGKGVKWLAGVSAAVGVLWYTLTHSGPS